MNEKYTSIVGRIKALGCLIAVLAFVLVSAVQVTAEEKTASKPKGKAHGKVFTNYHYDLTKDVDKVSVFELKRSYIGYKHKFNDKISTKLTLDVGSNAGGSDYTAFLKVAALSWKIANPVKVDVGLIGLKQWNTQEKFWGYRYIRKTLMDEYKFGSSADLGVNVGIKAHKMASINLLVINGEGYKKTQDAYGDHKIAGDLVLKPFDGLTIKGYFDTYAEGDTSKADSMAKAQSTIAAFIGYKVKDMLRVGGEFNMQTANKHIENNDLTGISAYLTYIINKQLEVFARFDQLSSKDDWNIAKDGNTILAGLQFRPVKGVSVAPNFNMFMPAQDGADSKTKIFVSFEYKF